MKTRYSVAGIGLLAGAGFLLLRYTPWQSITSGVPERITARAYDAGLEERMPEASAGEEQAAKGFRRGENLFRGVRKRLRREYRFHNAYNESPASAGAAATAIDKPGDAGVLPLEEILPLGDEPLANLTELFYSDCAGRCLYLNNGDGTVSKARLTDRSKLVEWYDENFGRRCFSGENFWLYANHEGLLRAWGKGLDSSMDAALLGTQCEE